MAASQPSFPLSSLKKLTSFSSCLLYFSNILLSVLFSLRRDIGLSNITAFVQTVTSLNGDLNCLPMQRSSVFLSSFFWLRDIVVTNPKKRNHHSNHHAVIWVLITLHHIEWCRWYVWWLSVQIWSKFCFSSLQKGPHVLLLARRLDLLYYVRLSYIILRGNLFNFKFSRVTQVKMSNRPIGTEINLSYF